MNANQLANRAVRLRNKAKRLKKKAKRLQILAESYIYEAHEVDKRSWEKSN